MKFVWITSIFIIFLSSSKADVSEDATDSINLAYNTRTVLDTEIKDELTPNENSNIVTQILQAEVDKTIPRNIKVKDNSTSKKQIKNNLNVKNNPSYVMSTRRPLMKSRTFTSKPHAVYNFQWETIGGQNNFASKRNTQTKKQFKPRHRNTHQHNKLRDSAENPFKYFKNMDTSSEDEIINTQRNKNSVSKTRRISAAASEIKSVTIRTFPHTNSANVNLRRKANAAIQKSLQNIKAMRPELKNKPIIVDSISVKDKNNAKVKTIKEEIINKGVTETTVSSKNNKIEVTTENPIINYPTEDKVGRNEFIFKKEEDSTSIAPLRITEKYEVITTESSAPVQTSEIRSKRGANIIEEEYIATTSTGFKFTGHESMGAQFNYKNIHT